MVRVVCLSVDNSNSRCTPNRQWIGASRLLLLGEDNGERLNLRGDPPMSFSNLRMTSSGR